MIEASLEHRDFTVEFSREVENAVRNSLRDAGQIGVNVARQTASEYNIGAIKGSVFQSGVEKHSTKGWGVWLIAGDWRAILFEYGTYTRRKRPLKQPRRSNRPNKGVKAGYFLTKGLRTARASLPDLLRAHMRRSAAVSTRRGLR